MDTKKAKIVWVGKTAEGEIRAKIEFPDGSHRDVWAKEEDFKRFGIDKEKIKKEVMLDVFFEEKNGKSIITNMKIAEEEKKEETTEIEKVEKTDKVVVKEKEVDASKIMLTGKVYRIGEKEIPDAYLTQRIANEMGIITETVEVKIEETDEMIFGIVKDKKVYVKSRARKGDVFVEAICHLSLKEEVLLRVSEYIRKALTGDLTSKITVRIAEIFKKEKSIEALFVDEELRFLLLEDILRIARFLPRTCETKAQERAQKKILNQEFREEEEIRTEEYEIKIVNETK